MKKKVLVMLAAGIMIFPVAFSSISLEISQSSINRTSSLTLLFASARSSSSKPMRLPICPYCGGGGGGSSPSSVTITIYVYGGNGMVDIGGTDYGNGQVATLSSPQSYSLSPESISQGFKFFQWDYTAGTVGSTTSTSTTFSTDGYSGSLALILNYSTPENWGGFILSQGVTEMSGVFQVPVTTGYTTSGYDLDITAIWVGIGGVYSSSLWQAGVNVEVTPAGNEVVLPWYEDYPLNAQIFIQDFTINPGDFVNVQVSFSNGVSTFTIVDQTTGQSDSGSMSFTPNTSTGEWTVEQIGSYALAPFSTITWSDLNYNLVNPIAANMVSTGGTTPQPQYVFPAYITNPNYFSVNYVGPT